VKAAADRKAVFAQVAEVASRSEPERVWKPSTPRGVAVWILRDAIDGDRSAMLMLPALLPRAPRRAQRAYRDRVRANLTGACPRCEAILGVGGEVTAEMWHEPTCSLDADITLLARWIDPRGVRTLGGMTGQF
jgi:hypothetical protein